jgi:hypothetical protein
LKRIGHLLLVIQWISRMAQTLTGYLKKYSRFNSTMEKSLSSVNIHLPQIRSDVISTEHDPDSRTRWAKFLLTVDREAENSGLNQAQLSVLMHSDDTRFEGLIISPSGERNPYKLQRTPNVAIAKQLEEIGLIRIVGYEGATLFGGQGEPLNAKTCIFAFTFLGVSVGQSINGQRTFDQNDHHVDVEEILHKTNEQISTEAMGKEVQPGLQGKLHASRLN